MSLEQSEGQEKQVEDKGRLDDATYTDYVQLLQENAALREQVEAYREALKLISAFDPDDTLHELQLIAAAALSPSPQK